MPRTSKNLPVGEGDDEVIGGNYHGLPPFVLVFLKYNTGHRLLKLVINGMWQSQEELE